jgi:hypothetical protein
MVEMRVIELTEFLDGPDIPHIEHRIQYRNDKGPWITIPVVRIIDDRQRYARMKGGSDG